MHTLRRITGSLYIPVPHARAQAGRNGGYRAAAEIPTWTNNRDTDLEATAILSPELVP
jgi:hypothetical protein